MTAILAVAIFSAGGIAGFLVCAIFAAGRFAETFERIDDEHYDRWREQLDAHARCADGQSVALEKLRAVRTIIAGNKTVRTSRIAEVIGE